MGILSNIGASQEVFDAATGETAAEYKPVTAGNHKATIKQILVYTNNFGDKSMRYIVNITEFDKDLQFNNDINSSLKDKTENKGYANRLKQFLYASNTEEDACSIKEKSCKINSFGKEYECDEILGMVGKPVIAQVLLMSDKNKAEGEQYKYSNIISGVVAMDGTDASGEDKLESFAKRCETTPLTMYEGYVKPSAATKGTVDPKAAAEATEANF